MAMAMQHEQGRIHLGWPPVPREHGAWFMLCMPMMAVLVGTGADFVGAGLLVLAVVSAFCGQYLAGLVLRGRGVAHAKVWLGIYVGILSASSGLLMGVYGVTDLMWLGTFAGAIMGWQLIRSRFSRKRLDRSISGELVAVAGLVLTAPCAYVVSSGTLSQSAIGLWGLFVLYFGSSVFFVKMHLLAAQKKEGLVFRDRVHLGIGVLVYHGVLGGQLVLFYLMGAPAGLLLLLGFAPVILRALVGWLRLSNRLPNLKYVGLVESVYTLWFSGCVATALRLALI